MKASLLMIEDERGLLLSVGDRLEAEGYQFDWSSRGDQGLEKALAGPYDLILVDAMLPGLDGFEIVKRLRAAGKTTPILMVTARDQIADRVSGLKGGADDYLVKPFAMDELVARIESHLRRAALAPAEAPAAEAPEASGMKAFGPFVFDPVRAGVYRDGERLTMTHQEFNLLGVFLEHQGQVLEPTRLLDLAWGYGEAVTSRTLYVHISWLRQKLRTSDRPDGPIRNVRGFGYIFDPE